MNSASLSIPPLTFPTNKPPVPWWNSQCAAAIRKRKKAINLFRHHPTEENFINFKKLRASAKRTIKAAKLASWTNFVSSIKQPILSSTLWNAVHKMKGHPSNTISLLQTTNHIITNPTEISNNLAHSFCQPITASPLTFPPLPSPPFTSTIPKNYNLPFSLPELVSVISSSTSSSSGPDNISILMLKNLPIPSLTSLLSFYNHLWTFHIFPSFWLTSIIIPIHKPGKPRTSPSSYRPIALTCLLGKLLEKMVNNRLVWVLETSKWFSPFQFGFRKFHSTLDHLASLDTDIRVANQKGHHVGLVALDISQAFDRTNPSLILRQLVAAGIEGHLLNYVKNFLNPRSFQVKANGILSDPHQQHLGVPQGAVLSPTLFNISMTSIIPYLPPDIKYKIFADDLIIYTSASSSTEITTSLQSTLNSLQSWSEKTAFSFSPSKSSIIHFCRKRSCSKLHPLSIHNSPIPYVDSLKILGLIFDSKLTWLQHLKYLKTSTAQDLHLIRSLSSTSWGADFPSLIHIYRSLILSKLSYADFIYDSASPSTKKLLEPIQNQAIRSATGAYRTSPVISLQCVASSPPLQLIRQHSLIKHYIRNLSHPHLHKSLNLSKLPALALFPKNSIPNRIHKFLISHSLSPPTFYYPPFPSFAPWLPPTPKIDTSLMSLPKSTTPTSLYRSKFHSSLNERYLTHKIIYSDGSKSKTGTGAAFATGNFHRSFKLSPYSSIFTAELLAIKESLKFAASDNSKKFLIVSDSRSSLDVIKNNSQKYAYSRHIGDLLHVLHIRGKEIIFYWVPSHIGIKGHDRVDLFAKEAILNGQPSQGENHTNDFLSLIKKIFNNQFQLQWDLLESPNKLWDIKPLVFPPLFNPSLSRRENTIWIRLAIGHTHLTHQHLLHGDPPPFCPQCNSHLSIQHIFQSPHYSLKRQTFNIPNSPTQALHPDFVNIPNIIKYLKDLGIYNNI